MYTLKGKDYSPISTSQISQNDVELSFLQELNNGEIVSNEIINRNFIKKEKKEQNDKKVQDWIVSSNFNSIDYPLTDYSDCKWGGYVGRIRDRKHDVELTLSSRLDNDDNRCFFLSRMIQSYVNVKSDLNLADEDVPSTEDEIFDFLKICIFRSQLIAAYNSGWFKRYTYFRGNDDRLKGRIDVARHIRLNVGQDNGKIAYEYREHTVDNEVNHLILRTWMELRKAYPGICDGILSKTDQRGQNANSILNQLKFLAPSYDKKSLQYILNKAEIPVTNELFSDYDILRKTCIDILNDLNLAIFDGENEETEVSGMVFYVPDLWELYLEDKMKKYGICGVGTQKGIALLTHPDINHEPNKLWVGRPDFYINHNGKSIILDAKCKPGWEKPEAHKHLRSDVVQLMSYGYAVDADLLGIIYPIISGENSKFDKWYIGIRNPVTNFLVSGLSIHKSENLNYEEWCQEMDKKEKKFFTELREHLMGKANSSQ